MSNTAQQPKCKDLVATHLESRIDDLRRLIEADRNGEEGVEDLGSLNEYGLAFDYVAPGTFKDQRRGYFRYQISWGGPSEEFRFYCNPDLSCHTVEFWYLDWFDGAHVELSGDDERLMLDWYQDLLDCEVPQAELRKASE